MSLKRRTPLKRTPFKRSNKRARQVSKEMKEAEKEMGPPVCVLKLSGEGPACHGRCHRHHVRPRGPGVSNGPDNLLWVCDAHHYWIHNVNPRRARELGVLR